MIARLVHYTGTVQGVGFRATAAYLARNHPVTGWVRNLTDGRVQLRVEGDTTAVDAFLGAVRDRFSYQIESEQIEEQVATGKYREFGIVR